MSDAPEPLADNVIPASQACTETVLLTRAEYDRLASLLLGAAETKKKLAQTERQWRAASDARDAAEVRILTLAQSLADALDFQNKVNEALASKGFYKGGEA